MDRQTRGMLVGLVLGDGYINTSNNKAELRILHKQDHKDYCEHKAERVRKALNRRFKVTIVRNGPGGRYRAAQFTASHKYFRQLKSWIYQDGQKQFRRAVLDMLTPEGIAFWYMDDGHARFNWNDRGVVSSVATDISTQCSEEEAQIISSYFKEEHGVEFRPIPVKNAFSIQASTEESRKFVELVSPYIIPSMAYKIAHVDGLDSQECRAPVGYCYQCSAPIYAKRRKGLCTKCYSKQYRLIHG